MNGFGFPIETTLPYLQVFADSLQWVAWPFATYFGARLFREPLAKLLENLRSVSHGESSAVFSPPEQDHLRPLKNDIMDKPVSGSEAPPSILNCDSGGLTEAQKMIREKVKEEFESIPDNVVRDRIIDALAIERIQRHFAFAYADIFGSQIEALEFLNQNRGSLDISVARRKFADLQEKLAPLRAWRFEQYVKYLEDFKLIEVLPDSVKLTPLGKEFIVWIDWLGLSKNRNL
ncbi:hypothetical protein [Rhodobacter lacus]|uniref:Uncharacterized protein n=1 Tax=Rhodobacter lacus TaxID=1641972 RepID=A0ABW5A6Y6_9RHOB